jgi:CPA2 family monovalent cation:H+ antiporter-2
MEEDSFKWETTLVDAPEYALVIGIGPLGGRVAAQLETTGHEVCVIDRSPVNIQPFEQQGFHAVAGDAIERETLDRAFATRATLVVICVPDDTVCLEIIRLVRRINPRCQVVVRCHFQSNMQRLTKAGATKVISAEAQVGEALVKLLGDP